MEREILIAAWREAVAACDARRLVRAALVDDRGRYDAVIALGKAAHGMRDGALAALPAGAVTTSLVVAGAGVEAGPPHEIRIGEHPIPGDGSIAAGKRALDWARLAAMQHRAVLGLVSGGASALCDAPMPPLSAADLAAVHRALVASGLPIAEMNAVRRRLSAVKGGGLAAALGSALRRVLVLVDVVSGDPRVVGSGPLSDPGEATPDISLPGRVLATLPPAARELLARRPWNARVATAPPPEVLASPATLAAAIGDALVRRGVPLAGPPRLVEAALDPVVERIVAHLGAGRGAWVAAGEVAVEVPAEAVGADGGRARHLALAVRVAMARKAPRARWWLLAAGSDGRDGAGAGGAVVGHETPITGAEDALLQCASGPWIRRHGHEIPESAAHTNLTDGLIAVAW